MLVREREVCQHIVLGEVHQLRESWPTRAKAVGNASPGRSSTLCIRLVEDGADGRSNHLLRAFWHQRQGVTHEMGSAPLPTGAQHYRGDCGLEPLVGITG